MKRLKTMLSIGLAISPVSVTAADVAGLMKTQPVFSTATTKSMYDLERCIIEVDAPIMPHIYRQPDRPQRVLIVWDGGGGLGGVSAALQIDGIERAGIAFWGREKVLRRVEPCLTLAFSN